MPEHSILTFIIASALLSLAPGPDNIFVLMQSAMHGKRSGIYVVLGLCSGLIVHTTAVALGVAAIFQTSAIAFTVLKLLGAVYLGYLAWQAFRAPVSDLHAGNGKLTSAAALYRRGIIMNITNPKVTIFFLAFLPQFTSPEQGAVAPQIFILGGVFMLVALVIFSGIAMAAGTLGAWLQRTPRAQLYLNRLAGTVFAGLALKLVLTTQHA